ncbi:MAG TPA: GNAT family N-acetyltransferase [Trebonia sp.]|jgi:GNAT superfamily N-acetyltransferase/RimJ/RimL family protein N-acetyltransferase|nr:GNAT family N-acetyltransferase [Trebonia sp.]
MTSWQPLIEPVDPADQAAFAEFYDVHTASNVHDRPDTFTPPGAATMRGEFVQAASNERHDLFLVRAAGIPVAAGKVSRDLTANRHLASLAVDVHPGHRRRGFGSALLARLEAAALAAERTALYVETAVGPEVVVEESVQYAFAAKHGYRLALTEQRRQLDLPAEADLAALASEAAKHHEGYQILTFLSQVPDEHLAGFAALMALIGVESPTGNVEVEPEDPDPGLVRQREARRRAQGLASFGAIVLSPDGEVVATTRMTETPGDATKLSQGGTIVHRDHRGHRLGIAVKIANLRQLGPAYSSVTTWNATANRPMIAINEALGFRLIEQGAGYQKLAHE